MGDPFSLRKTIITSGDKSEQSTPTASMIAVEQHVALLTEIKMLASYIDRTRREIVALGADGVLKSHVLTATDELDAIVIHTAKATSTILDVCEILDGATFPGSKATIGEATARIYEACSFQDITGQRVAKVVRTLQAIETRITDILYAFGNGAVPDRQTALGQAHDGDLLNGPQHPEAAMDQRAVDALLDTKT